MGFVTISASEVKAVHVDYAEVDESAPGIYLLLMLTEFHNCVLFAPFHRIHIYLLSAN